MRILIAVGMLLCSLVSVKHALHMFQQNRYELTRYTTWLKANLHVLAENLPVMICGAVGMAASFILKDTVLKLCVFALSLAAGILALLKERKASYIKPLVYTDRVKRQIAVMAVLLAVLVWFFSGDPFKASFGAGIICMAVLPWLLIYLMAVITSPIEKAVQNWYINDAKKILASCPDLHKVGITGSYGKTSMKFYLSELLSSQYETLKIPESFNTPMGVTITIRRDLKPTHQYFICEMGARRVHEIKELCGIANPHDGIITSVGPQHLETFGSIENVVNTKFELADSISALGKVYLNGDNELIRKKAPDYPNAITYGLQEGNDWRATDVSVSDRGTEFTVTAPDGKSCRYSTKLLGEHNVQNLLGAIAYAADTGIPMEKLVLPVKRIAAVPHRLQLLDKGNGVTFIDDAYNSNPSGCRAALAVLGLFDACRILVTPGMVELGAKQEELNYEFGQEASKACDYIVLVGKKQTEPIYNGIKDSGYDMSKVYVADSLNDALAKVNAYTTDKKKIVLLENDLPDNY